MRGGVFGMHDELRLALLRSDPGLSRFDPLSRIIVYDDFDRGLQGWTSLIGNYEGSLDAILPPYRDLRGPMLSNLSMWDTGTDGSSRRRCVVTFGRPSMRSTGHEAAMPPCTQASTASALACVTIAGASPPIGR